MSYVQLKKDLLRSTALFEDIHPRINQALAGLDEALASQQLDMDEDTHQEYLKACKRAHTLEESIKTPLSPFLLQKEDRCHLK